MLERYICKDSGIACVLSFMGGNGPKLKVTNIASFVEVILDLVLGPSARSRRDQASTPRDSRWDEIISHPRQPRFHSRSWVEIKSVRRNYSRTYGYGAYIDRCTVVTTVVHKRTYVNRCTYPISNFS
jgi:hypothetical protein